MAASPGHSSRRWTLIVVAAGLVTVATCGWWFVAEQRLDAVQVAVASDGVSCRGGGVKVAQHDLGLGEDVPVPVVPARADMDCSVHLLVRNGAGSEIHLDELVLPVLGPGAVAAVEAVRVLPTGSTPSRAGDPVDAVLDLDLTLPAGQVQSLVIHLAYRPDHCSDLSGLVPSGPLLHVQALGRSAVVQPALPAFGVGPSRATGCPS